MCGIAGVIGKGSVAATLKKAAIRMQNRGECSTRIVTFHERNFYSHGGTQPPEMAYFGLELRKKLPGRWGIVHVRYATTGSSDSDSLWRDMQPFIGERFAIAGNGDLMSAPRLRAELIKNEGSAFRSGNDIEVTYKLLKRAMKSFGAHSQRSATRYFKALVSAVRSVNYKQVGAWSNVVLLQRGLLAFNDPHGIRPLSMAKCSKNGELVRVIFASETTVFNAFYGEEGMTQEISELAPGQIIFVTPSLEIHSSNQSGEIQKAGCFFEHIYFARPDSKVQGEVVEVVRQRSGEELGREYQAEFAGRIDAVVGVPASALSAAGALARIWNVPFEVSAIIKVGNKRSFQENSQEKRKRAIDDKFLFIRKFIEGKRLALIDDSNVRGTTAMKIIQRLFELGAVEVHYFFCCPPIVCPCYYGIDTPDPSELIANRCDGDPQKIAAEMKASSVNYISLEGLLRAMNIPREKLCLACLGQGYPTPTKEAEARQQERFKQRRRKTASC